MASRCNQDDFDSAWSAIVADYQAAAADVSDEVWHAVFKSGHGRNAEVLPSQSVRSVHFSGRVEGASTFVEVDGVEIALTLSEFEAFVQLAVRRLEAGPDADGLTDLNRIGQSKNNVHQIVKRLRDKIDQFLDQPGIGRRFIVHGRSTCYFLRIPCRSITVRQNRVAELAEFALPDLRDVLNRLWELTESDEE